MNTSHDPGLFCVPPNFSSKLTFPSGQGGSREGWINYFLKDRKIDAFSPSGRPGQ